MLVSVNSRGGKVMRKEEEEGEEEIEGC